MDFALSDEQIMLQDHIGKALAGISPMERLRKQAVAQDAFAQDIWDEFCALGLPGILVPEEYGGQGMGALDAVVVAEQIGRYAVPAPFLGPIIAAPLAIMRAGSADQKAALLPRIAAGDLRIAIALSDALGAARAEVHHANGRLNGRAMFAVDVVGAEKILIACADGQLFLADAAASGLSVQSLETVDVTRQVAELIFDNTPAEVLGQSADVLGQLEDMLSLMLGADLLGAASHMLAQSVEYAGTRYQFGRPIGSFQAVKHLCVDMAAELEPGRALLWYAAHALDTGLPDARLCCLHAKAYLAEAGRITSRNATEVHGGIGITDELGLHYWFKRISWSREVFGGAVALREKAFQAGAADRAQLLGRAA